MFRNYQGERATLDGKGTEITLSVNAGYEWFWGLEITDSNTIRTTNQTGGVHPNAYGVGVYAPAVRFINNVVHDTAQGFSAYDASNDSVFYGNLSYYNGFVAPDRNHGHGFYMQNVTGTKLLQDNIVGDNSDEGLQIYGSGNANVVGFRMFGNASYNNSSWPTPHYQYNFLIAGGALRKDIQFDQNFSFFDPAADYGFVDFGQYTPGQDIKMTNSVFVGGYTGPDGFDAGRTRRLCGQQELRAHQCGAAGSPGTGSESKHHGLDLGHQPILREEFVFQRDHRWQYRARRHSGFRRMEKRDRVRQKQQHHQQPTERQMDLRPPQ